MNLEEIALELMRRAHTSVPPDVQAALEKARKGETSEIAKAQLDSILANISIASERKIPLCQDTGVHQFFVFGKSLNLESIQSQLNSAVRRAVDEIPLRPNLVDPLSRKQVSESALVHFEPSHSFKLHYLPKGAGSENMCRIEMRNPSETALADFITSAVKQAGGKPCPPLVLGIGIGGTFDRAAFLSKRALLRPIDKPSKSEKEILSAVNATGVGPMGLGGSTTCIGVNIESEPCHTASLPISLCIQCWPNRHAGAKLGDEVEYL